MHLAQCFTVAWKAKQLVEWKPHLNMTACSLATEHNPHPPPADSRRFLLTTTKLFERSIDQVMGLFLQFIHADILKMNQNEMWNTDVWMVLSFFYNFVTSSAKESSLRSHQLKENHEAETYVHNCQHVFPFEHILWMIFLLNNNADGFTMALQNTIPPVFMPYIYNRINSTGHTSN